MDIMEQLRGTLYRLKASGWPLVLPPLFGFPWERTPTNLFTERLNEAQDLDDLAKLTESFERQWRQGKISDEDYDEIRLLHDFAVAIYKAQEEKK